MKERKPCPRKFYKFLSDSSEFITKTLEHAVFAQRFYFSPFSSLDDPTERTLQFERLDGQALNNVVIDSLNRFDLYKGIGRAEPFGYDFSDFERFNLSTPLALQQQMEEITQEAARSAAVYCLSETWNQSVLWSTYANRHRGICLELDYIHRAPRVEDFEGRFHFNIPFEVIYSDVPPSVSLEFILEYFSTTTGLCYGLFDAKSNLEVIHKFIERLFCTKDLRWDYQREWRSVNLDRGAGYLPVPVLKVFGVTFGLNCTQQTKSHIRSVLGTSIKYNQITRAKDTYHLERVES